MVVGHLQLWHDYYCQIIFVLGKLILKPEVTQIKIHNWHMDTVHNTNASKMQYIKIQFCQLSYYLQER